LTANDFEMIETYGHGFFPVPRTSFLKEWITQKNSIVLGIKKGDGLADYGMIRTSESIFLDTPETNTEAIELAERYGMKMIFGTAKMYTKEFPDLPIDRVFGVTSFELG
jgi:hypothetical protein